MREWTAEHTVKLNALIRRQDQIRRQMWFISPVAEALMWLGFGPPEFYMRRCREGLEIYERQAVLLGIREER